MVWVLLLFACSPDVSATGVLYIFRYEPAAIVQLSPWTGSILGERPLELPAGCALSGLYPQSKGPSLAIELTCPGGAQVFLVDMDSGALESALSEPVDSHFLAWGKEGLYLRIDSLGDARIVRLGPRSASVQVLAIPSETYDLAPAPDGRSYTYSFSDGLGLGSELWIKRGGDEARLLSDPASIMAFASWSPDGKKLAFIRMPDSSEPYPAGELWVMKADGRDRHYLAQVDASHGYRTAWSPDSTRIAFIRRDDPGDVDVNLSVTSVESNLFVVDVRTGLSGPLTRSGVLAVGSPAWSPDGSYLVFEATLDGTIQLWMANVATGEVHPVFPDYACCPVWVRK